MFKEATNNYSDFFVDKLSGELHLRECHCGISFSLQEINDYWLHDNGT